MHANRIRYSIIVITLFGILLLQACRKWQDHNESLDAQSGKDLLLQINENTDLSRFASLLAKSGYDKIIAGTKTYTVYAPSNTALASLDAGIESDSARLRQFVGNHIALQTYYTVNSIPQRIPMLSGKFQNILGKKIDDAAISKADSYAKNGVLQVIDKMLPYRDNCWGFLEKDALMPALQKKFLLDLRAKLSDLSNAVQIGVDSLGRPVYQPGTDSVVTNLFWRNVQDVRTESKQYTFFVLTDAAWTAETNRLRPYYTDTVISKTVPDYLANFYMMNEYAIEGAYTAAQLPDSIVSGANVKLGIDKNAILQTIKTSNGYVHIMSKLTVRLEDKFKPIVIEAENYSTASANRINNTFKREMYDTAANRRFTDLLVYDHQLALFNYGYRLSAIPGNIKYRASWVAVNNNINGMTVPFTQKLGIDTATSVKYFGYVTVPLNSYREQVLGEFTLPQFRSSMFVFLTASNTTTANTNAIVCDYIKLEPVF